MDWKRIGNLACRWAPVVIWMAIILYLSVIPPIKGTISYSGSPLIDCSKHLALYAVLGGLLWAALRNGVAGWRPTLLAIGIGALYGLIEETHQMIVPHHAFEWLDLAMNELGVVIGVALLTILRRR